MCMRRVSISPISWWCAAHTRTSRRYPSVPARKSPASSARLERAPPNSRWATMSSRMSRTVAMSTRSPCGPPCAIRCRMGLDAADAIGLGLAFQTAHFALFARGQMKPGETVLVTGATGGVGIATVQLAKACGAMVVAGCMTASKAGFARDHGADHVVMLDRARSRSEPQGRDRGADRRPRGGRRGRQSRWARVRRLPALAGLVWPHRGGRFRRWSSGDAAFQLSADQEHCRRRAALERLSRPHAGTVSATPNKRSLRCGARDCSLRR